jgi:glycosyltransferase involved in cell wall biosynthesis
MKVLLDSAIGVNNRYGGVRRVGDLLKQALIAEGIAVADYRDHLRRAYGLRDGRLGRLAYLLMLKWEFPRHVVRGGFSHVHHVNYLSSANSRGRWRTLVHIHDLRQYHGIDTGRPLLTAWRNRMIASSLARADGIVTISHWEQANIETYLQPQIPVYVLPNAVGSEWEQGQDSPSCRGNGLVLPGPLVRRKGHLQFLQTHLDDILAGRLDVTICGTGEMYPEIAAYNREHCAGKVRLSGFVSDEALRQLYRSSLAGVYFSTYEGFGLPVIEMLSQGLPVFVRRNSVFPEILQARPQSLLPDEPAAFRLALLDELSRDDFEQRHAVQRSDWKPYTFAKFRQRLVEIYTQVPAR